MRRAPLNAAAPASSPACRWRSPRAAAAVTGASAGQGTGSARTSTGATQRSSFAAVPKATTTRAGLLGAADSAGSAPSDVPTGTIVADSGFRPWQDGFSFENYGNDAGPINLTPANVADLFGDQVCQTGDGASCVLTPSARHWMQQINQSMANGHCMGFLRQRSAVLHREPQAKRLRRRDNLRAAGPG